MTGKPREAAQRGGHVRRARQGRASADMPGESGAQGTGWRVRGAGGGTAVTWTLAQLSGHGKDKPLGNSLRLTPGFGERSTGEGCVCGGGHDHPTGISKSSTALTGPGTSLVLSQLGRRTGTR